MTYAILAAAVGLKIFTYLICVTLRKWVHAAVACPLQPVGVMLLSPQSSQAAHLARLQDLRRDDGSGRGPHE